MNVKKVLCPIDFSPQSEAALEFAVSVARDADAELILLHVAEPEIIYGETLPMMPNTVECHRQLDAVVVDPAVRVLRRVVVGFVAEKILEEAAKQQADLIVMGTHGRTGLSHVFMGSVAECVVRKGDCPVLTLKSAAPVETEAK